MAEGRQQASAFHATAFVGTAAASTSQAETAAAVGGEPREPEKRKRGRPKKPKPKAEQLGEPRPKRPRGRPKGSKNKLPSKVKAQLLRESVQSRKGRLSKSECLIKPDISGVSQTVSVSFWTRKNPEGGPQTSGPR